MDYKQFHCWGAILHIIVRETWGEYETATSFSGSLVPRRARRGMDVCDVIHRADWDNNNNNNNNKALLYPKDV